MFLFIKGEDLRQWAGSGFIVRLPVLVIERRREQPFSLSYLLIQKDRGELRLHLSRDTHIGKHLGIKIIRWVWRFARTGMPIPGVLHLMHIGEQPAGIMGIKNHTVVDVVKERASPPHAFFYGQIGVAVRF